MKTSDKKVKVTWYKNTTVIKETTVYKTTFDGLNARLTISSVKTEHVASYRVVVSNEFGQDESSARLVLKEDKKVSLFNTFFDILLLGTYPTTIFV